MTINKSKNNKIGEILLGFIDYNSFGSLIFFKTFKLKKVLKAAFCILIACASVQLTAKIM